MNALDPFSKIDIPPRVIAFAWGAGTAIVLFLVLAPFLTNWSAKDASPITLAAKADEQPNPSGVARVVGSGAPDADIPCKDQAWPYIDAACLKVSGAKDRATRTSEASTDGVASPSDRATDIGQSATTTVLPDRHNAVTGEPALMPQAHAAGIDREQTVPKAAATAPRKKSKAARQSRIADMPVRSRYPN